VRCEEEALESFSHLLCGRGHAIGSHSAPLFVGGCRENRSPKGRSALAELGVRATVRNAVGTDRHPATHEVADFRSPPVEAIQRVRREFPDRLVEKEHSPVCASVGRPAGRAPGREMHSVDRAGFTCARPRISLPPRAAAHREGLRRIDGYRVRATGPADGHAHPELQHGGFALALNGSVSLTPFTRTVIQGSRSSLSAPSPQTKAKKKLVVQGMVRRRRADPRRGRKQHDQLHGHLQAR
jgi:hypothetical protein